MEKNLGKVKFSLLLGKNQIMLEVDGQILIKFVGEFWNSANKL
jgi:hypothetical protein